MADTLVDRILHPGASAGSTTDARTTPGTGARTTRAAAGWDSNSAGHGSGVAPSADDPVAAVRAAYARAGSRSRKPSERSRGSIDLGGRARPPRAEGMPPGVGLEIGLIVTDRALFGDSDEPAWLGGEVIPAALARGLVAGLPASSKAWVRRLYTRPETGQLVAMDSRRRLFDDNLRRFIVLRDQRCRTPWCDAPIRHADHAQPAARGGPTSADNGDGLSEDCNYVREAPGWHATGSGGGTLTITTPTGHAYASNPPALHRPEHRPRLPATGSE